MEKAVEKTQVLVDLFSYGIIELKIAYCLEFFSLPTRACNIECHIFHFDAAWHSWLYSPDFKFVFAEVERGTGHAVCFASAGPKKNMYYQIMLNVVADYIFLKEKIFH
ncbi:hypothetical protein [uncultured Pedobacter sp.]|uniref:hypothetical protein n=1 Tax=uncultured Pedobacter sp. TaxID=246139 RepID=UPI0025F6D6AA|nr:hypothetical protein [uncultured Pedobacter sp.]